MREITPYQIKENIFDSVNNKWMLITVTDKNGKVNTMTASWGGFGIMWNKPVCVCVIRPQRYTNTFAAHAERITLSFLEDGNREALKICGTKSGRDCDKIAEAGLHTVLDCDVAYFEEAKTVIVGKKLYVDLLKEDCFLDKDLSDKMYPNKDYHYAYICEIEKVLTKE